jgi:hypothetical protein
MALQEAAEAYLVSLFEDTNLAAIHAKRVTMYVGIPPSMLLYSPKPLSANPRIWHSPVVSEARGLSFSINKKISLVHSFILLLVFAISLRRRPCTIFMIWFRNDTILLAFVSCVRSHLCIKQTYRRTMQVRLHGESWFKYIGRLWRSSSVRLVISVRDLKLPILEDEA